MQQAAVTPVSPSLSPLVRLGPIDDLEDALIERWTEISQATYRFLALLREFDFRQGWKAYGCTDCAQWMDFRLKVARKTALEKVRVARALWFVPRIDAAFKAGEISYSQVRAMTRVADAQNEADLLARAATMTAGDLEKYCQRLRQGDVHVAEHLAKTQQSSRSLLVHVEGGEMTVKLPPDQLAIVQQALERLVDTLPEDPDRDYFAARADALVEMARCALSSKQGTACQSSSERDANNSATHQVLVHVDAAALSEQGGQADYPLPVIKKLCCSGEVTAIIKDGDRVLNVGRKHRLVPPKLRQALAARDRHCQFPGCHHTQFLDAHHIEHWCDGGETKLDNLILLCSHHHMLMHEGGFSLRPRGDRFYFARPDGRPIELPSSAEDGELDEVELH
ncbi:MAG: DUF222 domain-containing protein [Pseudomonadales bacterium]